MINYPSNLVPAIEILSEIHNDFFFIQGAGGNISVKSKKFLWVKRSGISMNSYSISNIFVKVRLDDVIYSLFNKKSDNLDLKTYGINKEFKASIETYIHAIINKKIVLHLHPIGAVAVLVQRNCKSIINSMNLNFKYAFQAYKKPGRELAISLNQKIIKNPYAQVFFLENHGVVVAANTPSDVKWILNEIKDKFNLKTVIGMSELNKKNMVPKIAGYSYFRYKYVSFLSRREYKRDLFKLWASFPDNIVFLGPAPVYFISLNQTLASLLKNDHPFFILQDVGIFIKKNSLLSIKESLKVIYEIFIRIERGREIFALNNKDVKKIVSWNSEIYRKKIAG